MRPPKIPDWVLVFAAIASFVLPLAAAAQRPDAAPLAHAQPAKSPNALHQN